MAFWINIFTAGVSNGTALLFATLGELFAERAGVVNLGVEGMMLFGAVMGYSIGYHTGSAWLGLLAVVAISLRADQVVSGLSLTFLGIGLSLVFGEGLSQVSGVPTIPSFNLP